MMPFFSQTFYLCGSREGYFTTEARQLCKDVKISPIRCYKISFLGNKLSEKETKETMKKVKIMQSVVANYKLNL